MAAVVATLSAVYLLVAVAVRGRFDGRSSRAARALVLAMTMLAGIAVAAFIVSVGALVR